MPLKSIAFVTLTLFSIIPANAQIGLGSNIYQGRDAKLFQNSFASTLGIYLPPAYFSKKLRSSAVISIYSKPTFRWEVYSFKNNVVVSDSSNHTTLSVDSDPDHKYISKPFHPKSMMQYLSFRFPLYISFKPSWSKYLYITPGAFVEWIVGGRFSRTYADDGRINSVRDNFSSDGNFYNIKSLQYGLIGTLRYRFITVFGMYSLSTLFIPSKGPDLRRVEYGILLNFFWKRSRIDPF